MPSKPELLQRFDRISGRPRSVRPRPAIQRIRSARSRRPGEPESPALRSTRPAESGAPGIAQGRRVIDVDRDCGFPERDGVAGDSIDGSSGDAVVVSGSPESFAAWLVVWLSVHEPVIACGEVRAANPASVPPDVMRGDLVGRGLLTGATRSGWGADSDLDDKAASSRGLRARPRT